MDCLYIQFQAFVNGQNRLYSNNFTLGFNVFAELQKNPVEGFSAGLVDDEDIYKWEVLIIGPPDTF